MGTRPILDPRLASEIVEFFPSTCDIQETTQTRNDDGEYEDSWSDVVGLTDIGCQCAPNGGVEVKLPDQTFVVSNFTVLMKGEYPTVVEKMRVIVSGPSAGTYDILLAQTGSQEAFTRLLVRKVT